MDFFSPLFSNRLRVIMPLESIDAIDDVLVVGCSQLMCISNIRHLRTNRLGLEHILKGVYFRQYHRRALSPALPFSEFQHSTPHPADLVSLLCTLAPSRGIPVS